MKSVDGWNGWSWLDDCQPHVEGSPLQRCFRKRPVLRTHWRSGENQVQRAMKVLQRVELYTNEPP